MFALQYITATDGLKTSYRSAADQTQRSNSALKRKARQEVVKDNECSFGPPDKKQHFSSVKGKNGKNGKGKSKLDEKKEGSKEVEVLYADGNWYKGWLSSFNFSTGKWKVQFYDDNETTEVKFPDKDVRVINSK